MMSNSLFFTIPKEDETYMYNWTKKAKSGGGGGGGGGTLQWCACEL